MAALSVGTVGKQRLLIEPAYWECKWMQFIDANNRESHTERMCKQLTYSHGVFSTELPIYANASVMRGKYHQPLSHRLICIHWPISPKGVLKVFQGLMLHIYYCEADLQRRPKGWGECIFACKLSESTKVSVRLILFLPVKSDCKKLITVSQLFVLLHMSYLFCENSNLHGSTQTSTNHSLH